MLVVPYSVAVRTIGAANAQPNCVKCSPKLCKNFVVIFNSNARTAAGCRLRCSLRFVRFTRFGIGLLYAFLPDLRVSVYYGILPHVISKGSLTTFVMFDVDPLYSFLCVFQNVTTQKSSCRTCTVQYGKCQNVTMTSWRDYSSTLHGKTGCYQFLPKLNVVYLQDCSTLGRQSDESGESCHRFRPCSLQICAGSAFL